MPSVLRLIGNRCAKIMVRSFVCQLRSKTVFWPLLAKIQPGSRTCFQVTQRLRTLCMTSRQRMRPGAEPPRHASSSSRNQPARSGGSRTAPCSWPAGARARAARRSRAGHRFRRQSRRHGTRRQPVSAGCHRADGGEFCRWRGGDQCHRQGLRRRAAGDPLSLDRPTGDISRVPAMSEEEFLEALNAGAAAVGRGADLLAFGEMGIGNTTIAAALAAAVARRHRRRLGGSRHRPRRRGRRA